MSNEARKFIESLFTRDPLKRATAKQCLAHDWIVKYAKNTASIKLEPVDFRQVEREKQKEGLNFLFNHSFSLNQLCYRTGSIKSRRKSSYDASKTSTTAPTATTVNGSTLSKML